MIADLGQEALVVMLDKHKCGAKVHDPSSNQDQDQQSLFANLVLDPVLPLDVENPETGCSSNFDSIEVGSQIDVVPARNGCLIL